ncbi:unnamed protein product, partial [Iphiclides podalirius]
MSRGKKWSSVKGRGGGRSTERRERGKGAQDNFREQRIDGAGLPLLTEEHLTGMLQMKLGPALKLRAVVARRLEACAGCQATTTTTAATTTTATVTPVTTPNTTPRLNGAALKPEPRSNSTSPS